jgi:hypothetical protein
MGLERCIDSEPFYYDDIGIASAAIYRAVNSQLGTSAKTVKVNKFGAELGNSFCPNHVLCFTSTNPALQD